MSARPRVLYLLRSYPASSETYIKAEIEALRDDFDLTIVAAGQADSPYSRHQPFTVVTEFAQLREIAEDLRPDVLHAHWLQQTGLIARLSELVQVPFTIRSHSHDVSWGGTRGWLFDRSPWAPRQLLPWHLHDAALLRADACLGVLCFPFARPRLVKAGIPDEKLHDCYPVVPVAAFLDRSPNGDRIMGVGTARVNKQFDDFFDVAAIVRDRSFDLYATPGPESMNLRHRADALGPSVRLIDHVEPEGMPTEYKRHEWLLYTASRRLRTVGWPVAVAEAQASGVGVCMPSLRPDLADYIGPGGYLYDTTADAARTVSQPFPAELRELGFEQARRSDVAEHKRILTDLWAPAIARRTQG